jgi:hypothetical protein
MPSVERILEDAKLCLRLWIRKREELGLRTVYRVLIVEEVKGLAKVLLRVMMQQGRVPLGKRTHLLDQNMVTAKLACKKPPGKYSEKIQETRRCKFNDKLNTRSCKAKCARRNSGNKKLHDQRKACTQEAAKNTEGTDHSPFDTESSERAARFAARILLSRRLCV